MASLPHIIDDKTLPETPAHEWANDTTSALGASTTSTPGQDFPGAYPSGHELSPSESKNTTLGILDTAKSYIPAQKDVENAFLSASGTAKHYLPESVASYLPGTQPQTSLPSQEVGDKITGSRVGIGSLPGSASETSVAKLPEERAIEDNVRRGYANTLPSQETDHDRLVATAGAGRLLGSRSEVSVAKPPLERESEVQGGNEQYLGDSGAFSGNQTLESRLGEDFSTLSDNPAREPFQAGGISGLSSSQTREQTSGGLGTQERHGYQTAEAPFDASHLTRRTNQFQSERTSTSNISNQPQDSSEGFGTSFSDSSSGLPPPITGFSGAGVGGVFHESGAFVPRQQASPREDINPTDQSIHKSASGIAVTPDHEVDKSIPESYVRFGSNDIPKERNTPSEGKSADQESGVNTTARTHPLGKDGAKWKGVPLSEGYQHALDGNSDRQLNLGNRGDSILSQSQSAAHPGSGTGDVKGDTSAPKGSVGNITSHESSTTGGPPTLDANRVSNTADSGHSDVYRQPGTASQPIAHASPSAPDYGSKSASTSTRSTGDVVGKGDGGTAGSPGKTKFIDKIKGEVKAISGKFGH